MFRNEQRHGEGDDEEQEAIGAGEVGQASGGAGQGEPGRTATFQRQTQGQQGETSCQGKGRGAFGRDPEAQVKAAKDRYQSSQDRVAARVRDAASNDITYQWQNR